MKFHPKHTPVLMAFFISTVMSVFMSGVVTLINLGTADFISHWLHAWIRVWPLAFVAALIATPIARRIVSRIVAAPSPQ
jgi:hypothetical protein